MATVNRHSGDKKTVEGNCFKSVFIVVRVFIVFPLVRLAGEKRERSSRLYSENQSQHSKVIVFVAYFFPLQRVTLLLQILIINCFPLQIATIHGKA